MEITKYNRVQTPNENDLILLASEDNGTRTTTYENLMKNVENKLTNVKSKLTNPENGESFYFDFKEGKYGFNTNPNRGADTFVPFSSGEIDKALLLDALQFSGLGLTMESTPDQIYAILAETFPGSLDVLSKSIALSGFVRSGNTYQLYGGNRDTYGSVTSEYFDVTLYKTLQVSGTLSTGLTGAADPSSITLALQPENAAVSNFVIGSLTTSNSSVSLTYKDITNLSGNYRLYISAYTYNDSCTATINKFTLTTN